VHEADVYESGGSAAYSEVPARDGTPVMKNYLMLIINLSVQLLVFASMFLSAFTGNLAWCVVASAIVAAAIVAFVVAAPESWR
jgi:hypothetical protein